MKYNKEIVEYILASNIKSAIYQALIESKDDVDFSELMDLAFAVAGDTTTFLEKHDLISIPAISNPK